MIPVSLTQAALRGSGMIRRGAERGNRRYYRTFDHAEAHDMRAAGLPVTEIARRLGVSVGFIYRITKTSATERGKWVRAPLEKRVMGRVEVRGETECWPWLGPVNDQGYGLVLPNGSDRPLRVHRVVYELFVESIPVDHDIDHLCHNTDLDCPGGVICEHRRCCNPNHLQPATRSENVRRGAARRRRQKERA